MAKTSERALDGVSIRRALSGLARDCLRRLTVREETDSTNAELARLPAGQRHAHAILADSQTRGRGRRQRTWHSPRGGNIYLSLGWRFEADAPPLSALPLATAVCVCRALDTAGLQGHGIKWPNDILVGGAKLAGILVESQSGEDRSLQVVIGIGVNVRMPRSTDAPPAIDRPWTDLVSQLPPDRRDVDRNALAATLLNELLPGCERFAAEGFGPFRECWLRRDLLTGRRVVLQENGTVRRGTATGIDPSGGLMVDIDGLGKQVLHAADVSILDGIPTAAD